MENNEFYGCENCDAEGCNNCRKPQQFVLMAKNGDRITFMVYEDYVVIRTPFSDYTTTKEIARESYKASLEFGAVRVS